MTADSISTSKIGAHRREIVLALSVLAAIHVFIFTAAFPFFTNVDEPAQFDLVLKYSHGHIPVGMEAISPESAIYLAFFSSSAYYGTPEKFPGDKMPAPPWTESPDKMKADVAANAAGWQRLPNYEAPQAPLYYKLAGLWWNAGKMLGFHDGRLLYWLRFLNIGMIIAAVWLGYTAAKMIFPENLFVQLAVPALIAFIPQAAYYTADSDPLSPVCFGLVFIFTVKWLLTENPSYKEGALAGLAFAATWLTKATNLPLLATTGLVILIKTWCSLRQRQPRAREAFLAFIGCAAIPALPWMLRTKKIYGDFTGSGIMIHFFTWIPKPFSEWWHHPIFTPRGLWVYLSGQFGTFWQGEFSWLNHSMFLPGTVAIYTLATIVLLVTAASALWPKTSGDATPQHRVALGLSLACLLSCLGFFALISIMYDFNNAPNPTREYPYIHEGRLMLGILIPFLLLIAYGLDHLLRRFGNTTKFLVLAGVILAMLATEIATDWPAFSNPFNWYHLP